LNKVIPLRTDQLCYLVAEIDWALDALTHQKGRLRALRNTIPPISSLPSEILALIFSFANQRTEPHISLETPTRLSFAQVCRIWRTVALGTPSLWVRPMLWWPAFTKLMLTRARALPIVVECRFYAGIPKIRQRLIANSVEAACRSMARIRLMDLYGPGDVLSEIILDVESREATQLEVLRIEMSAPEILDMPRCLRGSLARFLLGQPPGRDSLWKRHFDNTGMIGISPFHPCSHLTELVLKGGTFVDTSLGQLLVILRGTCILQKLVLEGVYSDTDAFDTPSQPPDEQVQLERLRLIHLCEYISGSTLLLEHLSLPPDVMIHLDDGHEESDEPEITRVMTVLTPHLFSKDGRSLLSLRVEVEDAEFKVEGVDDFGITRLKFRAHWWDADTEFNHIFKGMVRALPIDDCVSLTLAIDHRFLVVHPADGENWCSAFARLHQLEALYLHDLAAMGFIQGLQILQSRAQSSPLPSLRKLELYHVDLAIEVPVISVDDTGPMITDQRAAIDFLEEALLKRAIALEGTSFDLILDRCRLPVRTGLETRLKSRGIKLHLVGDEDGAFWDT
jgi:hypothetical protein